MKVRFKPAGGRFGYGFDYYCPECGDYLGNSYDDAELNHDATVTKGIFKKTVTPVNCSNAGKRCEIPKHEIEALTKT